MSNVVTFRLDDVAAEVDLDAITGTEWRDMKRATGLRRRELLSEALLWEEFDAQAAFVWIAFRQDMPNVDYEQVLALFSVAAVSGETGTTDG